ncbi:hypothetical protein D3C85_1916150 [compost metagenome]
MYCHVDLAVEQRLLDLFDEQAFATDLRQGDIQNPVPFGYDLFQFKFALDPQLLA